MKSKRLNLLFASIVASASMACAPIGQPADSPSESIAVAVKEYEGYAPISMKDVVMVQVTVYSNLVELSGSGLTREYSGAMAHKILHSMGLNQPQEVGFAAAMRTGELVLTYMLPSGEVRHRSFNILNERVIEDRLFPEVTYRSSMMLDREWLEELRATK